MKNKVEKQTNIMKQFVTIPVGDSILDAELAVPQDAQSIILFVHGSGSSRHSPRNQFVADYLNRNGLATLLFDLLTVDEENIDIRTRQFRFDVDLLADRLSRVTEWIGALDMTRSFDIGYFGASTGAAAALISSVSHPGTVKAIVSRGGRPDMAADVLPQVKIPVLLIVGGDDPIVIDMNRVARQRLDTPNDLAIVPGATHLFQEPGALEEVAHLAKNWFLTYLQSQQSAGTNSRQFYIDSCSFGAIIVSGVRYTSDVIIYPDKIRPDWRRKESHSLEIEDVQDVIAYRPHIFIVGSGASGTLRIPEHTRRYCEQQDIQLKAYPTDEACRLFNKEMAQHRKVVGAFHLT